MNQWKHIAITVAFALAALAIGAVLGDQFIAPRQNPMWMYAVGICTFLLGLLTVNFLNPGITYTRERELLAEIDRLRAGLKFYAEQEHMILQDWEEPDEPGWQCPPSREEIEEYYGKDYDGLPWMVEDGGVARIILRGGRIVGDFKDDLIARMDPPARRHEFGQTLLPCFKFDFGDKPLILRQTDGVQHLVDVIGEGPLTLTVSKMELTKRQLRELPEWG